ncbi:MAG: hypothetical protein DBY32_03915 [Phascolarctobacterium sp.]|nr:MAG: hypothetical protein DBY32_03915 [Phascolarctobacterium sp.]
MRTWLKELRLAKALTQAEVAEKLGINQNTYSRLEMGTYQKDLNISTAAKLADIFKISLSKIRNYEEALTGK